MHSRICLLCASLLIGVSVYGQSLKINEVDKFSKEKKVYTSFEKISSESVMMVSFSVIYLHAGYLYLSIFATWIIDKKNSENKK